MTQFLTDSIPKYEIEALREGAGIEAETLYKYREWSNDHVRRMLRENEIYLSSPGDFNDPFDCLIEPNFTATKAQQRAKYAKFVRHYNHGLSRKEVRRRVSEAWSRKDSPIRGPAAEMRKRLAATRRERFGVFSMAESHSNLLMWSHYADSHKGICVGFRVDSLLLQTGIYALTRPDLSIQLQKVDYEQTIPTWNIFTDGTEREREMIAKSLKTKSIDWDYEKEWRLFLHAIPRRSRGQVEDRERAILENRERTMRLPDDAISEVYLGLQMCPEHKEEIKDIIAAKGTKVKVMEARKSTRKYALHFKMPEDHSNLK